MNKITEKEQFFLDNLSVDGRLFGALRRISQRIMGCEPMDEVPRVSDVLAKQLVDIELLVEGPADARGQKEADHVDTELRRLVGMCSNAGNILTARPVYSVDGRFAEHSSSR